MLFKEFWQKCIIVGFLNGYFTSFLSLVNVRDKRVYVNVCECVSVNPTFLWMLHYVWEWVQLIRRIYIIHQQVLSRILIFFLPVGLFFHRLVHSFFKWLVIGVEFVLIMYSVFVVTTFNEMWLDAIWLLIFWMSLFIYQIFNSLFISISDAINKIWNHNFQINTFESLNQYRLSMLFS